MNYIYFCLTFLICSIIFCAAFLFCCRVLFIQKVEKLEPMNAFKSKKERSALKAINREETILNLLENG
jgi:hypothetical protein